MVVVVCGRREALMTMVPKVVLPSWVSTSSERNRFPKVVKGAVRGKPGFQRWRTCDGKVRTTRL